MSLSRFGRKAVARAFGQAQKWYWDYIYDTYRSTYEIDPAFVFHGYNISIIGSGRVQLGARTYIGESSFLASGPDCALTIGEDCAIARNVRISTNEKAPDRVTIKRDPIVIGDRVRIGVNCYIGSGVAVGDDSVIGANSVVKDDVPAGAIVGGVPARLIRMK